MEIMCVLVAQSYLTLCDSMDCSPPGSSDHGILQARILGVGCHSLFHGIFPTQAWDLLSLQQDSLPSELPGKTPDGVYIIVQNGLYII